MIQKNIEEITKLINGYRKIIIEDDRQCSDAIEISKNRENKSLLKMYEYELTRWQKLKECIEKAYDEGIPDSLMKSILGEENI